MGPCHSHLNQFEKLSNEKGEICEATKATKDKMLKQPVNLDELRLKVYGMDNAERKELYEEIGGTDGAFQICFQFYRRIYANAENPNAHISKFCTLFIKQRFDIAVDRIASYVATDFDGDLSEAFWNIEWINNMHNNYRLHQLITPKYAQMWISFMWSGLQDVKIKLDQKTKLKFINCLISMMNFMFLESWKDAKDILKPIPVNGLINEDGKSAKYWMKKYKNPPTKKAKFKFY